VSSVSPARALALVLSRLGGQARGRLVESLRPKSREQVLSSLETVDPFDRADMSSVEQILVQELDALFGESESQVDTFREFYSLRVADIIALLLLKGSSDAASATLLHLPHSVQAECIHAIATQDWSALEDHLGADERELVRELDEWLGDPPRQSRPDFAVAILRNISGARQLRALLTDIHHRDSEIAKTIQAALFSIEDLRRASDRELQTLTTGLDDWDLAIAFLGMSDGLRRRILANVSQRRAAHLEDDVAYLDDSDDDDVESACDRMIMRARSLYEHGQMQTYLGSVSADPVDPDEIDEEEVEHRSRKPKAEPTSESVIEKRSPRGVLFGAVGVALIVGAWYMGVGQGGRPSSGRSRVSASDFASRERASSGGGNAKGKIGGQVNGSSGSGVTASDGDVFVVSGKEKRPIDESTIRRGDVIETGPDGRALVTLSQDESRVEVGSDSELQIGEEEELLGPPKLSLRLGNIWVQVKNPALEVHSPVASVSAASGALYQFRVVLSSATTINVEHGTTWVQSKVGGKELVVVEAGKSLRIEPRGGMDLRPVEDRSRPRWLSLF
jgi:flagellar motor switch protein FliG